MKIYCINLARSHRRRQLMEREFKRLNLAVEFVTAIDARKLNEKELSELSDTESAKIYPNWLRPGIIACSLSHRLCFHKMIESQQSCALILEDDVIFGNDTIEVLKNLETQIKTGEVLLLYFQSFETIKFSETGVSEINANHRLMYPVNFDGIGSSGAYLISLDVAQKLYDYEFPVKTGIDSWGTHIESGWLKSLRVVIPFAASSSLAESAVDYINPKKLKGKIKSFISRLRLFPFYQLLRWNRKRNWMKTTQYVFTKIPSPLQKQ